MVICPQIQVPSQSLDSQLYPFSENTSLLKDFGSKPVTANQSLLLQKRSLLLHKRYDEVLRTLYRKITHVSEKVTSLSQTRQKKGGKKETMKEIVELFV